MTDKEFIAGIISGEHNQNDVQERCKGEGYNVKALFLTMYAAAPAIFQRHGVAPCLWIESARRFDLQGAGLQMYQYPDFVRLQNAMAVAEACLAVAEERPTAAKADADSTKAGTPQPLQGIEAYITATDKGRTLKALHSLLDGKGDTQAAPILAVAVIDGFMTLKGRAFFAVCHKTFGISTPKSGLNRSFHRYVDCNGKQISENGTLEPSRKALQNALNDIV